MNYCPLDEAWNLYDPSNQANSEPEKNVFQIGGYQINDDRGGNNQQGPTCLSMNQHQKEIEYAKLVEAKEAEEKANKEKMKQLILSDKGKLCQLFLKHLEECHSCQNTMRKKFGGQIMEKFENLANLKSPNYFEIFVVLLVGIFIIIIMDSFVKLGKMMKK